MANSNIVVTDLAATGGVGQIVLAWDWDDPSDFKSLPYMQLAVFEVWAASSNNLGSASKVGETRSSQYSHAGLSASVTRYYWVRARDVSGNHGEFSSVASATSSTILPPNNSITGDMIKNNEIGKDHLKANSVTADKISVTSLEAISANLGDIEVGSANIANLAVDTIHLRGSAVETAKIGGNQVSSFSSAFNSSPGPLSGYNNQVATGITVNGGSVLILVGIACFADVGVGVPSLRIRRGSSTLVTFAGNAVTIVGGSATVFTNFFGYVDNSPPNGGQTYTLQGATASGSTLQGTDRIIVAANFKR